MLTSRVRYVAPVVQRRASGRAEQRRRHQGHSYRHSELGPRGEPGKPSERGRGKPVPGAHEPCGVVVVVRDASAYQVHDDASRAADDTDDAHQQGAHDDDEAGVSFVTEVTAPEDSLAIEAAIWDGGDTKFVATGNPWHNLRSGLRTYEMVGEASPFVSSRGT